jgi:hypothetical protein
MSKMQKSRMKQLHSFTLTSSFILLSLLMMGCEGFKFTGSMCESLQPGQVSNECRAYDEDEAQKASVPVKDDSGECLKCNEAEKLEIRQ